MAWLLAWGKFIEMAAPKNTGGLIEMKSPVHRCLGKHEIHLYPEIARKAVGQNSPGWFDAVAKMYTKGAIPALLGDRARKYRALPGRNDTWETTRGFPLYRAQDWNTQDRPQYRGWVGRAVEHAHEDRVGYG